MTGDARLAETEQDADDGAPRCPACESPRIREKWTQGQLVLAIPLLGLPLRFMKKPVVCEQCGTASTDGARPQPHGYRARARRTGDPVFRLVRGHAISGAAAGLGIGSLATLMLGGFPIPVLLGPVAGWLFGHGVTSEVCSKPGCSAPLGPNDEVCARCGGAIVGTIQNPREHHLRKAAWHRGDEISDS